MRDRGAFEQRCLYALGLLGNIDRSDFATKMSGPLKDEEETPPWSRGPGIHPCPGSGTSEHAGEVDTMSTDARNLRHLPIAKGSGVQASAVDVAFIGLAW